MSDWPRCPRCGGQVMDDLDDDASCLQCGHVIYKNPPASHRSRGTKVKEPLNENLAR